MRHSSTSTLRSRSTSAGIEADVGGDLLQHQQALLQHRRVVGGHVEGVDGLVERGAGVGVLAEAHADLLDEVDHLLLLEQAGAVERHVLDEVGQPPLLLGLQHRPGVHRQAQGGPLAAAPGGGAGSSAGRWAGCASWSAGSIGSGASPGDPVVAPVAGAGGTGAAAGPALRPAQASGATASRDSSANVRAVCGRRTGMVGLYSVGP